MKRAGMGLVLLAAAGGAAVLSSSRRHPSSPSVRGSEADISGGVVGVETLMKQSNPPSVPVRVHGVVSGASPKDRLFALVDAKEVEECGTTTCAPLTLPIRWAGVSPAVRTTVWVEGRVQAIGGRLIFVARQVRLTAPNPGGLPR